MIQIPSGLSPHLAIVYLVLSSIALIMCSISLVAVSRTRKIPRPVKLLSMGLLVYDILFLLAASISHFFDFHDIFVAQHLAREFQIAVLIIIATMSLDRWFVLGFPYIYLRIATEEVINKVCIGVILGSILQYLAYRALACYTFNKILSCDSNLIYYGFWTILLSAISIFSQVKVFMIARSSSSEKRYGPTLRQYKGSHISFLCLVNQIISLIINIVLLVIFYFTNVKTVGGNGHFAEIANFCYLMNCFVDPLIYVIWLRETRLEILKMFQVIFPYFEKTIEDMRIDIFNIVTVKNRNEYNLFKRRICTARHMNQVEHEDNIHRGSLNQIKQEGNIIRAALNQAILEVNLNRAPLNQAIQEKNIQSATFNHGIQEGNMHRVSLNQAIKEKNIHSATLNPDIQEKNIHSGTLNPDSQEENIDSATVNPCIQ